MTTRSMYESALGDSFAGLQPAVQRLHRLKGRQVLHGWVSTDAPATRAARLLALCLGSPQQAVAGPLRFELDAQPEVERWTRGFPSRTMVSQLRLRSGQIEERLGAARLIFALSATADGMLSMALVRMRFFGLPCPRWLQPRIVAEETGEGDRFHFRVSATVPGVGLVASYRGHLDLGPA